MDVIMPQLGETVTEGTVVKWYKRVGDAVRADELLFDVETDKVSMEIPAPSAGVLTEIVVGEGSTAKVGVRLAVITAPGERTAPAGGAPAAAAPPAAAAVRSSALAAAAPSAQAAEPAERASTLLSPVVRRLCAEHGIDPSQVRGTGPGGRLTREDVLAYVEAAKAPAASAAPAPGAKPASTAKPASETPAPAADAAKPAAGVQVLNSVRRRTAEHMARAWTTVPHVAQAIEVDFSEIDRLRRERGAAWKSREGFSLTYMPFIARAVTVALGKFPRLNAVFGGDSLRLQDRVNLGIAVDLELDGLVVPVVKDCQSKSLLGIARAINDLSQRARAGKLVPDEVTEGTYTITNNGAFGTLFTTAIVNVPQVAILSVDGIRRRPVVVESAGREGIAVAPVGMLAQSFDHRAVDGAYSASFLKQLRSLLEGSGWERELG